MRLRGRAAPPELVPKEITRKNRGSAARLFSNSARIVRVSGSELPSSAMTISNRSRGRLELITDWRQFRKRDLPLNTGIPIVMSLAYGWGRMAASRTSPIPEPPVSARSSRIESDFVRLLHSLPMCEMTGGQHRHDDAPCYRRPRVGIPTRGVGSATWSVVRSRGALELHGLHSSPLLVRGPHHFRTRRSRRMLNTTVCELCAMIESTALRYRFAGNERMKMLRKRPGIAHGTCRW